MKRLALILVCHVLLIACSSSGDSNRSGADSTLMTTPTESEPPTPVESTEAPSAPASVQVTCDADAGGNQVFDVPLGTEVTLVAISSTEREYHLHGYDLELVGSVVTFQFTASIPGASELTEHPGHSTVCTIVS